MKTWLLLTILMIAVAPAKAVITDVPEAPDTSRIYLIYLHGRIIENAGPRPVDSRFGLYDYPAVLAALESRQAMVISAQRPPGTDFNRYAGIVVAQIEALIERGVAPANIVVVGFSKGGGIASRVSSFLRRPQVRFVLLAARPDGGVAPQIRLAGHVLSIHEQSDPLGTSCQALAEREPRPQSFEEIRISTGRSHGAFYTPLPAWIEPLLDWVHGDVAAAAALTPASAFSQRARVTQARP